jgi:nitroreductase
VPTTAEALAGLSMPLLDAMMTQRAVRRVNPDPVDDAVVLKCIELALRAPTGANGQNWEFIVVKDRRVIEKLARRYRQGWKFSYGGCFEAPATATSRWRRSYVRPSGRSTTSPRSRSWWWPACDSPSAKGARRIR